GARSRRAGAPDRNGEGAAARHRRRGRGSLHALREGVPALGAVGHLALARRVGAGHAATDPLRPRRARGQAVRGVRARVDGAAEDDAVLISWGAPGARSTAWGPRDGPQAPNARGAPAQPWRPSTMQATASADLVALDRRLIEGQAEPGFLRHHELAMLDGRCLLEEPERPRH